MVRTSDVCWDLQGVCVFITVIDVCRVVLIVIRLLGERWLGGSGIFRGCLNVAARVRAVRMNPYQSVVFRAGFKGLWRSARLLVGSEA